MDEWQWMVCLTLPKAKHDHAARNRDDSPLFATVRTGPPLPSWHWSLLRRLRSCLIA
jgi:hypothetical protein